MAPTPADPTPNPLDPTRLTHLDAQGRAQMVDVSGKPATVRVAIAEAVFGLDPAVRAQLFAGALPKGEALAVARVAGIQAAKDTARLIPLCHPLPLSSVVVDFAELGADAVRITAECKTVGATGVEMEAMTAASVAALVLYDMVKGLCRGAAIRSVALVHKSGGKSGVWERDRQG
jgi:cyclic pyranopterin phosphate synthase